MTYNPVAIELYSKQINNPPEKFRGFIMLKTSKAIYQFAVYCL